MTKPITTATATVTLTLEVKVDGTWTEKTTMQQIREQASQEAVGYITQRCQDKVVRNRIKIVGKPTVVAMVVPE